MRHFFIIVVSVNLTLKNVVKIVSKGEATNQKEKMLF